MKDTAFCLNIKGELRAFDKPLIMAILNLNSDSFFDGNSFQNTEKSIEKALGFIYEGADIIDLGPSSSKPGMKLSKPEKEISLIKPVLKRLKEEPILISVDTYWAETAEFALKNGAHIINDISGGKFDPAIWDICAFYQAPYILMHIHGVPESMQKNPMKETDFSCVYSELFNSYHSAKEKGIKDIIIDPGIGFGKDQKLNYQLLRYLDSFSEITPKILFGASRKSMFYKTLGLKAEEVLPASLSAHFYAMQKGAKIIRIHDVAPTFQTREVYLHLQ